jgi:sigma-B regulation protein RsbU (phosphoserine phosphatase)
MEPATAEHALRHNQLAEKTIELARAHELLQQAYRQIDQCLDLARRVQVGLLPQSLPEVPRTRIAVRHAPREQIGGDFYDVFRLDERHVGFYVADAMGHGVPACLLTTLIKNSLRTKDVVGQQYRLLPPGEVLQRLNHALVELALAETPFLTMGYALFNHADGTLCFARAGYPFPLLVPRRGEPRLLKVEGSLLGVFDTEFPTAAHTLRSGDKVLFFSDGMDAARFEKDAEGVESLLACASRHRALPIGEFVERLAQDLFQQDGRADDVTLLGLEMTG